LHLPLIRGFLADRRHVALSLVWSVPRLCQKRFLAFLAETSSG
jgi:hypothetical protein